MTIHINATAQGFMIGGDFRIFLDGRESAWVGPGGSAELAAEPGEHELQIKSGLRSASIRFDARGDVTVSLRWNRVTGKIETLCTGPDCKLL